MKRISRNPQKFDLARVVDEYARSKDLDFGSHSGWQVLLTNIESQIRANQSNDALMHGLRVEAMFAFVASALGECLLIKDEDSGEVYSSFDDILAPDYRLIKKDNEKIFVEVKNYFSDNLEKNYEFSQDYFLKLQRYASIFECDLYFAIYWVKLRIWTLLSDADFAAKENKRVISLENAIKKNRMSILGDRTIGTIPELSFKLYSDSKKPRAINSSGHADFTVGNVELQCGEKVIEDDIERNIAWFLMNYGNWSVTELPPEVVDGELISVGIRVEPEHRANPEQRFEMVGSLSEMISRQFTDVTAPEGQISVLSPDREPETFGVAIPSDYRGKALPLWRFTLLVEQEADDVDTSSNPKLQ